MDATTVESIIAMPLGAAATNSNTNMSCGSSSSSSNSSGYASATTPTNPASAGSSSSHSQYSDSHSSTPVGLVEPTPVATIAAVTPYYNETFQQQQQQQHQHQQHQPQLHHPPHPQYQHQTHSYQLPEQLPTSSQYDNAYDAYAYLSGGEGYQQSVSGAGGGERNLLGMRHTTTYYTTLEKPSKQHTQMASNTANNNNNKIYNNSNSETPLHTSKRIGGESNTPAKPQAAATPFYAHSAQTGSSSTYGEPIKYRMSTAPKLPTLGDYMNYGNQPLDISNTMNYTQNFPQHHAGKPLHDVPYGAAGTQVKAYNAMPNARLPQQRLGMHYGNAAMPVGLPIGSASNNSNSNNNNSSIYIDKYDKYLYTAVTTVAQSSYYTTTPPANLSAMPYSAVPYATASPATTTVPPQYAAEMPNDAYRKSSAASSWHWSMEYNNGNCRSLPPPHNGIPTAAIPPTNASYVPSNATAAATNRDIYYTTEKYNNKYDKYNAYYNPHQQYMTSNATGRSAWSNSPHASAHHVPPALAERLSHPYPHHAPLPTSGVPNTLAPSAHPSLAYHHPYTPTAATAAARQNCCSQPFQQQNCYNPRTTNHLHLPSNGYNPHGQTSPYGATGTAVGSNNSSVVKYNLLDYGPISKSKLNTNDVYATMPAYEASNMNYHSHPAGMAPSPQYANATGPTVGHPPLNRNITPGSHSDIASVYYNDLNMHSSYDNYLGPIQPTALVGERRESLVQRVDHLPNLPPTYTQSTNSTKNSLIDYRKPAVTPNDDSFIAEPTLTNLDEHMATNMSQSQYDNSYSMTGELRTNAAAMYHKTTMREGTVKPSDSTLTTPTTPTTKTYSSLRDFLSTWNEDEEDYGGTDDLQFVEHAPQAIEQVMHTEHNTKSAEVINKMSSLQELANEANTPASYGPLPLVVNNWHLKEAYNSQPKAQARHGSVSTINMEENQCANINLPDIVIDIEKSGGVTPNITSIPKTNTTNVAAKSSVRNAGYDCFDVEKELDELKTKKVKIPKLSADTMPIRNGSVIMKAATEALGVVSPNATVESENLETIENIKTVHTAAIPIIPENIEKDFLFAEHRTDNALSTVQTKTESAYDRSMECENTTSSNGSTFEKEYETFINKIGSEFDYKVSGNNENNFALGVNDKSAQSEINTDIAKLDPEVPPIVISNTTVKQSVVNDMEIAQKIKSFSKFYKRKRKSSETSKGKDVTKMLKQSHELLEPEQNKETNITETSVKRCGKRKSNERLDNIRLKYIHRRKNKATSYYQRSLRALRRYWVKISKRLDITALLKEEMVEMSEKILPLTARLSITQYSNVDENEFEQYFNPKTLKCLSVAFINSEAFRNKLLKGAKTEKEIISSTDINTNEEIKSVSLNDVLEKEQNDDVSLQTTDNIDNQIYNEISSPVTLKILTAENNIDVNMSNAFEENMQKEHSNETSEIVEIESAKQPAEQPQITELSFESIEATQNSVDSKNHTEVDMTLPTSLDVKDSKNEFNNIETGDSEEVERADYTTEPRDDGVEASTEQVTDDKHDDGDRVDNKVIEAEAYDADISADDETETMKSLSTDIPETLSELNTSVNLMDILESQFNDNESVEYRATDLENLVPLTKEVVNEENPTEDLVNQLTDDVQITQKQTAASDLSDEKVEEEELEAIDLTWPTTVEEDSIQNPKTELNEFVFSRTHDDTRLTEFSEACNSAVLEGASRDAAYSTRNDDSHSSVMAAEVAESPFKELHSTSPVHMKSEISNSTDITMLKAFDLKEQATEQPQCFSGDVDLSDLENSLDMFGARRSAEYFTATSKNYFDKTGDFDENSTDSNSSSSSDSSSSSSGRRSSTSSSSSSSSSSDENTQSSISTVQSDFNEMKELERELSQHQANEFENDEKTAAATYIGDNSSDGVYINSSKTITENDIKTLKKILESDSDGHEEIRANLGEVKDDSFEDEEICVDRKTSVLKEQHADTANDNAEDNKQVQNEDSNASNGVSNVTMPMAERDCVDTEVLEECVERRDKTCDVEGLAHELAVEENQTQNETLFCAAINVDDDGSGVPSLKKISIDYLEKVTSNEDHTLSNRTEDALNSKIPKLSDLCKNALSSSFEISADNNNSNNTNQNTPETLERELSVEEALAEMYRQAGVPSDPEDGDAEEREAQDVVLINLEEILVNDSDLYVLQCDMNENVLSVVAHAHAPDMPMQVDESIEDIERTVNAEMPAEDMLLGLESPQAEVIVTDDNMQTDFLGPFVHTHDDVANSPTTIPLTPYITPPHTVEYVEGELRLTNYDLLNTQFDFPAIHHEEIVSHDYKRLKRQAPPW